jgi:hypothetical protein
MEPSSDKQTKRMRRVRRNIRRLGKDLVWLQTRRRLKPDPTVVEEVRKVLSELCITSIPKLTGVAYQESRLPKPDGPSDCLSCKLIEAQFVPIADQRRFEGGLAETGRPPGIVYEMPEYKPSVVGKGRGVILLSRQKHADHPQEYVDWKSRTAG